MEMTIDLQRPSRRYVSGEVVVGEVKLECKGQMSHNGVSLTMEGTVLLEVTTGIKKAFTFPKPLLLTTYTEELAKPGSFLSGTTTLPFQFKLEPVVGHILYETFHGNDVNVRYLVKCVCARGFARKNIENDIEFLVETKTTEEYPKPREVPFTLTLANSTKKTKGEGDGKVKVTGKINSATCQISQPFLGEIVVEETDYPIANISLQLMRVETCGHSTGFLKEASEVQRLDIADGDIVPRLPLMIFLIWPRLYTCPTVHSPNFKIEFELNIIVELQNEAKTTLTHTLPVLLVRV